ncbi:single-stranded DNA-binding protein [Lactobacillus hominis]|uniref:Single-stranded DNA-binding protein n=1 Tax=Lactobacillus hominis DSM 23910 = CRBIP 24.179 TaxID=1423758 RepID=I7KGV3_9LACO|nr:single-stranded DNA-binding protein [Lactobacillus hominis]KRM85861.1 hypothetical protein FC41_GL000049 [Lactobacillus hominis DSM 23910 = CRBIP 24.179]MCT3348902.1 single-stranded DNA-binding protein [Lactobacillus hominis]CCI81590.1 Single-stranded DNA-binding protein [Lactobacillus hominis DSM 23910 = CRBIP 24.179]
MFNFSLLEGRLTKDPELRNTGNGTPVASFTLAVDRPKRKDGTQQADFINIVAWNKTAEFLKNYFKKGDAIQVQGRIQTRSYDDKNGNKVFVTEIIANQLGFPITQRANSQTQGNSNTSGNANNASYADPFGTNQSSVDISDADLPF